MKIKEFKEILKMLPDNADIVIQKRITNKWTLVAPVLNYRLTKTKDLLHDRLVLINMKPVKSK